MLNESVEQKIRNLEALAQRPGTPEEGELAKSKAIELAQKHNQRCIFTDPNYKPPAPKPKPMTPTERTLRPVAMALEKKLKEDGWLFAGFFGGKRIYKNAARHSEEIHMSALWYGEFTCQHLYVPSGQFRPAGNTPEELEEFFNTASYRLQLWPTRNNVEDDFLEWRPEAPHSNFQPVDRVDIIDEMLGDKVFVKKSRKPF